MTEVETTTRLASVGNELVRHDAIEKVAGRTRYAADLELPRMLHARLKRSDEPHARIVSVDASAARRIDGVVGVYLAADVPRNTIWSKVPGQTAETGAVESMVNVLADGVIRYHGEPIALVAAESEDAADAAVDAVEVELEPLPVVDDPQQALEPDAPPIHEGGNLLASWELEEGDVDAALASAAFGVEARYSTQFVDHAYLEPEAGVAWLDTDGVIVVRSATQVVEHFRSIAHILDVPDNSVRVIAPYIGGGFGGKEDLTVEAYIALVVHKTGRPVRMVWSRQESLIARPNRHAARFRYVTAADAEGRLVAQDVEMLLDGGAYAYLSAPVLLWASMCAQGPYSCPNVRIRSRVAYTHNPPCSAMRGFGAQQVTFAYEGQMDTLAVEMGIDPLELRRRNFLVRGDTLAVGHRLETHVALPELAASVRERMGPRPAATSEGGLVGRGFACNLQSYGFNLWLNDTASAWVSLELDGTLVIRTGVPDIGAGQASSLVQIASEPLGVSPERVKIHIGDSTLTPLAGRTSSTRQLYMSGNAVLAAARLLRDDLEPLAASLLDIPRERVEFSRDGVRDAAVPDRVLPLGTVAAACAPNGVATQQLATFRAPTGKAWRADPSWRGQVAPDFTYGCHGVDVEVDPETGQVRILRYVAAHDVGRAINPQSVRGQIEGGAVMGIGQALSEEVVVEDALNLTGTFAQYLLPTAAEAPVVEAVVHESGEGLGPFNARGIGEPPVSPPSPAIAAALRDATGVFFRATPLSMPRVSDALAARGGGPATPERGGAG
jgi:CO/xanthine dehydrogenase Mo-binding subunit